MSTSIAHTAQHDLISVSQDIAVWLSRKAHKQSQSAKKQLSVSKNVKTNGVEEEWQQTTPKKVHSMHVNAVYTGT